MILMRRKGHSSFSYADLVTKIGISKAYIQHHFPSEEMLG
ncbi:MULTISPECIES: TetR family transcriptional regulator [Pectobacterium]